jgi:nitrate reductase gamma subunit
MSLVELIEGPLWWLALAVFLLGVGWRIVALLLVGKPKDLSVARRSGIAGALEALLLHSVPHGGNLGRTLYHFMTGYLFHIGLFVLVLFAAPHVAFIEKRLVGVEMPWWPELPRWGFIIAAEAAFAGLILLYIHRMTDPVKRALSDIDDHLGVWLTFIAMLTGCLALQEAHAGLRALHMLSVQALMVYFPFSRLMHAFTFAISRSYTGATYGRRGFTP